MDILKKIKIINQQYEQTDKTNMRYRTMYKDAIEQKKNIIGEILKRFRQ